MAKRTNNGLQKTTQKTKDWPTQTPLNQVLWKGRMYLLKMWHLLCYTCYKPSDKTWMRKEPDCYYDKRNISTLICDTNFPVTLNQVMVATVKLLKWWLHNNHWLIASLLTATLYQGHPDRNDKLWNIETTERYILHMQVLLECCYI